MLFFKRDSKTVFKKLYDRTKLYLFLRGLPISFTTLSTSFTFISMIFPDVWISYSISLSLYLIPSSLCLSLSLSRSLFIYLSISSSAIFPGCLLIVSKNRSQTVIREISNVTLWNKAKISHNSNKGYVCSQPTIDQKTDPNEKFVIAAVKKKNEKEKKNIKFYHRIHWLSWVGKEQEVNLRILRQILFHRQDSNFPYVWCFQTRSWHVNVLRKCGEDGARGDRMRYSDTIRKLRKRMNDGEKHKNNN